MIDLMNVYMLMLTLYGSVVLAAGFMLCYAYSIRLI